MFGIGCVAEETRHAHAYNVVEVAIAEAKLAHDEVESKGASLAAQTEPSSAHVVDVLSEHVKVIAEHSEAQASHVVGAVTQQLEKGLEAVVTSAATTSE